MAVPPILHNVIGTVRKNTEEEVFLEIEGGITRHFIKDADKKGAAGLKPGDDVLIEFDDENRIVDIVHVGEKHQLMLVHGEAVGMDSDNTLFTLKLKNGTSQSYKMKEAVAGKMSHVKKGTAVTLMVDQQSHSAIDAHVD